MNRGDVCLSRFWDRLCGLSPVGSLGEKYRGWVFIPNCRSIHTFTLRRPIDLEWIDRDGKLIRRECSVPPRSIRRCPKAYGVRERYSKQTLRSQEGWGATETILVLPIALMIFFFAMQLAYIAIAKVHLGHALREGMRAAAAELSAPDALVTEGMSHGRVDRFPGAQESTGVVGQDMVRDAFEDAILRALRAWSIFYGETKGEGISGFGGFGYGSQPNWVATLTPGQLQSAGVPSNLMAGAPQGSASPDHLVGELSYRMPIKMPFFGPSLAKVFAVSENCSAETERSLLCVDANRWYWRLRARARIPVPATRFESFAVGEATSMTTQGVDRLQSNPSGDDSGSSHREISAVATTNDSSSRQASLGALPQTITALIEELQVVSPQVSGRGSLAVEDCGIQFGS
ncbi:MAG: pilus assembly protein [Betaproteobacteria bacterium]|nr:hypothetical protein [Pseudomonadota bacterium]NCW80369.1 pilus assembly protein [Betaproteobacteria bacterium]NDA92883.1 pilus assembly protein [Betaproteobacteria bacterium]